MFSTAVVPWFVAAGTILGVALALIVFACVQMAGVADHRLRAMGLDLR